MNVLELLEKVAVVVWGSGCGNAGIGGVGHGGEGRLLKVGALGLVNKTD
jgi:hypothetical protein